MGKMKSKRAPLHSKAAKIPGAFGGGFVEPPSVTKDKPSTAALTPTPKLDGIFSKVDIDMNAMSKELKDDVMDDTKSGITSRSLRGKNLKKAEKQKLRHEFFMKKIDTIQQAKKERQARKKREKTVIVGDMQGLANSLPTLDLLLRDLDKPQATVSKGKSEGQKKTKPYKKEFTRKKQMNADIATFHQVREFSVFKANPMSTITEHLRNKLEQESMEQE